MAEQWRIRIGGVRGSSAITGEAMRRYGGDTLSIQLLAGDELVYLDAGTGLLPFPEHCRHASVLIGHPHLDHICGLGVWSGLFDPAHSVDFYLAPRMGMGAQALLECLYAPPLWPIRLNELPARVRFFDIEDDFTLGGLTVSLLEGEHPGGVTHFRIGDGRRSLVYAVDEELTEDSFRALCRFASGCDLLLCDGQYTAEELPHAAGWGHSSMTDMAHLGAEAVAGQTLLLHYAPTRTDDELDRLNAQLQASYPACRAAREGEELWI